MKWWSPAAGCLSPPPASGGWWRPSCAGSALDGPDGRAVGDVYVCTVVAAREARAREIPVEEELIRLVVHGTLHALGREHPEGGDRTRSAMWRRQERYVEALA